MATTSTHWMNDIATTYVWDENIEDLYESWHRRVAASARGHRLMADRLYRRHVLIGISVVLLTTLTAAAAIASLRETGTGSIATGGFDPDVVLLVVGSICVLAAILAGLQTFLRSSTKAEGHRIAVLRYEALRHEMATMLAIPRSAREQPDLALTTARFRMNRYARESPKIGERLWRKLENGLSLTKVPPAPAPPAPTSVNTGVAAGTG